MGDRNGRKATSGAAKPRRRAAKASLPAASEPEAPAPADAEPAAPAPVLERETDVTIAFTPRQLAAGAAIIAGLILLVGARHRRNRERRIPDED